MLRERMKFPKNDKNNRQEALTCIRSAYTMAGTPEYEDEEVNQQTVKHFLNTLAEVSLSITLRSSGRSD